MKMITACELCAKITVETAMREEAIRIAKAKTAKAFAEEVISPILEKLTEIPNHLEIGFRYHNPLYSWSVLWHWRVAILYHNSWQPHENQKFH